MRVFGRLDGALASNTIWAVLCVLALALQAALIVNHAPWPDEYQAIMLAVQAPDLATLFEWLRYEGHPPLWYILLRGLAYLFTPLSALWIAALLIALPTQAIILFASPFRRIERLLIVLSEFVLFDFLTISRSLTLGVALMVLAMALWRSRWVWLAIALLPMCDFLFGVISGIFVLLLWREKRLWWPGIILWLVISAITGWSVIPAQDTVTAIEYLGVDSQAWLWFTKMSGLLIPFQGGFNAGWNKPLFPVADVAWIGFLALCWYSTRKFPFHALMLFGFIGLTLAFSLFVYPIGLRHLMLIALLLILLVWLQRSAGAAPEAGFALWLALAALSGIGTAAINFITPFHTADRVVAEIQQRGLQDKHWLAFPDWRVPSVSALSGMEFERAEQECMMDFVRWDYRTSLLDPGKLEHYLTARIARDGRFYLLSDLPITGLPEDILHPIAEVEEGYDGIPFYLFVVGRDAEEKPISLPDCVPAKRPFPAPTP